MSDAALGAAPSSRNPVLLALVVIAAAAVAGSGFVSHAPNRLLGGEPLALWQATGGGGTAIIALLVGLALAAIARQTPGLHRTVAAAATGLLLLTLWSAGDAAATLAATAPPAARTSLGPAFWTLALAAVLAIVDALQRRGAGPAARLVIALAIPGAIAALAATGSFDALSLMREYATRRDAFAAALWRHCALVLAAVGPALLIGVPLGIAAARRPAVRGTLFPALNLLQTIPSVALFGLLIAPLSALGAALPALGLSGIGFAPAAIALVLYSLLPVVRNTEAGLRGVDAAIVEAARGMGLSPRQVFRQVELPLALPVFLAGLRIVLVQAIGLAVVAALIGAGGFGSFVFQGLGQYALDLVLLGAVPAILLALAADFLMRLLIEFAAGRRTR